MKKIKKIFALLIAMVMVLGTMSMSAFAADTNPKGSITINPAVTDPQADTTTYEAYKIFDMTTNGATDDDGNYTAVAYTINSNWANFFAAGGPGASYIVATNPGSLNPIAVDGTTKYINITDSNVAAFAKAAYTSIVSLTSTSPDAEIAQKAKYPTLTKEADDISVEVGQKVTYTLKSTVPDTTGYTKYEMVFADTTTAGLTFDGVSSIKVTIGGTELAAADYSVSTANPDFELTIDMLKDQDGKKVAKYTYDDEIVVTYTATVNEAAVVKIDENNATLKYNNNPKDDTSTGTTPPVVVKTYSSKVVIEKVDGADSSKMLEGAKFVLRCKTPGTAEGDSHETDLAAGKYYFYDATAKNVKWVTPASVVAADLAKDTTITVVTTDANGAANFDGLEDGVYELIEVEAPKGYNLLTTPTEFTIAGSDTDVQALTVTAEVKNNSGTMLPSTGGIGTTIFYIIGAILVIGAGVVLVTRRRMNAN